MECQGGRNRKIPEYDGQGMPDFPTWWACRFLGIKIKPTRTTREERKIDRIGRHTLWNKFEQGFGRVKFGIIDRVGCGEDTPVVLDYFQVFAVWKLRWSSEFLRPILSRVHKFFIMLSSFLLSIRLLLYWSEVTKFLMLSRRVTEMD